MSINRRHVLTKPTRSTLWLIVFGEKADCEKAVARNRVSEAAFPSGEMPNLQPSRLTEKLVPNFQPTFSLTMSGSGLAVAGGHRRGDRFANHGASPHRVCTGV